MDIFRQFSNLNANALLEVNQNLDQDASAIAAGFCQVQDQILCAFADLANVRPAGQVEPLPFPCDQNPTLMQVLFHGDDLLQHSTHEKKLRDPQLIYYQHGGDFQVRKDLGTSVIEHHHRFEELIHVAELLPAGDIAMPNESLTLEWFYMTFHKSERK